MKIVKVTYTVKAEFSQVNMSNVNAVMSALRAAGSPGTRPEFYSQHSGTRAPLCHIARLLWSARSRVSRAVYLAIVVTT